MKTKICERNNISKRIEKGIEKLKQRRKEKKRNLNVTFLRYCVRYFTAVTKSEDISNAEIIFK